MGWMAAVNAKAKTKVDAACVDCSKLAYHAPQDPVKSTFDPISGYTTIDLGDSPSSSSSPAAAALNSSSSASSVAASYSLNSSSAPSAAAPPSSPQSPDPQYVTNASGSIRLRFQQSSHTSAEASTSSPSPTAPPARGARSPPKLTKEQKQTILNAATTWGVNADALKQRILEHKLQQQAASQGSGGAAAHSDNSSSGRFAAASAQSGATSGRVESSPEVEVEFTVGLDKLTTEDLDKVREALQAKTLLDTPVPLTMGPNYKVRWRSSSSCIAGKKKMRLCTFLDKSWVC